MSDPRATSSAADPSLGGAAPSHSPPFEPSPTSILLDGRRAVVTGAARGIGRAIALALARFGAQVAVCDRLEDELADTVADLATLGLDAPFGVLDVRDGAAVDAWVGELELDWPSIDLLVNNAGGGFVSPVAELTSNGQAALIAENFTQVVD